MGVFASFYHLWSILSFSPWQLALSFFFLLNSKLNFICLFSASCLFLFYLYRQKELNWRWLKPLSLTSLTATWWSLLMLTFQKSGLTSLLGFQLLPELFKNSTQIFVQPTLKSFTLISFLSSYGVFGWMTQYMPIYFYLFFAIILLLGLLGFLFYLKKCRKLSSFGDNDLFYFLMAIAVVIFTNLILHILAGFGHSFQPQGRYLLPSTLLIYMLGFSALAIQILKFENIFTPIRRRILFFAIIIFAGFELKTAIESAKENLFLMGYGYSNIKLKQELSHEKTRELITDDEVIQSFQLDASFQRIYLRTSSFQRANSTQGQITLSDCKEKIFYSNNISFEKLKSIADYNIIDLEKPVKFESQNFCLSLKVKQGKLNHSIALQKSMAGSTHLGKLTINGELLPGDLVIKVY
jgi:hypothetical protein